MAVSSPDDGSDLVWGVGSVAERLALSASTLRTWERRYGVGPTHRTAGGHRRYTEEDIARVDLLKRLVERGAPPRDAARVAHTLDEEQLAQALTAEIVTDAGAELTPEQTIEAVVRAALDYDAVQVAGLFGTALRRDGVITAWDAIIAPTLIRVGEEWSAGRLGIEAEHLVSEALVGELRMHTRSRPSVDTGRATILLASAEDDLHALPVFALEGALAEEGLGCHVLGSRFPAVALSRMTQQLRPDVVFLWASMPRVGHDDLWDVVSSLTEWTTAILGGPGWPAVDPQVVADLAADGEPLRSKDLASAVDLVLAAVP